MRRKQQRIEMRIVNVTYPRFVIIAPVGQYWTGKGWSPRLRDALLYAHADLLRDDIEALNAKFIHKMP